jgi:manganese transport protein
VLITRRRDVMGALVNRQLTTAVAVVVAAMIVSLNLFLLADTFGLV